MNREQFSSIIKYTMTAVGGWLAGHGLNSGIVSALTGPDALTFYTGLFSVGIPAILSYFSHTTSAKLAAVEAMPEVKKIVVSSNSGLVNDIAIDPNRPKVTERN